MPVGLVYRPSASYKTPTSSPAELYTFTLATKPAWGVKVGLMVDVNDGVRVRVCVGLAVLLGVALKLGVDVAVAVGVDCGVFVPLGVLVKEGVDVIVNVGLGVSVAVDPFV